MNDNEIITAWKCCSNVITSSCKECPLHLTYNANCVRELMRVSLGLYNRQKAENFNLKEEVKHFQLKNSKLFKLNNSLVEENDYRKAENERLQSDNVKLHTIIPKMLVEAKSEAYREFAEKTLEKVKGAHYEEVESYYASGYTDALTFVEDLIDEIKDELTEKNDLEGNE